jgi:hypothetical protein
MQFLIPALLRPVYILQATFAVVGLGVRPHDVDTIGEQ